MSSLWTPGGERPVPPKSSPPPPPDGPKPAEGPEPSPEERAELEAHMAELRQQLASTPAAVVVANHCFGLFELAALHLSLQPPQLDEARLAIDALAAVVEGLGDRLGDQLPVLKDGLAQLRLAYVQIHAGAQGPPPG